MNWSVTSFAVLAIALSAGFAWYERSRPHARVLALVAALAALAIVGRLAFAAVPNVKPTTDIVLFAGYVLGGAPGFVVGALAALVSNVFLTQGPWTAWQMAAWGGVGVAGAGLARVARGRELGRWPLAIACGLAGLAFGAVMDVYQWTFAAEQDPASYLAVAAASLPYNLAHAAGNVVFCLAFGPALVRAIGRYRRRFEVRWPVPGPAAAGVLAAAVLAAGLAAPGSAGAATPSERAVRYLERAQNPDGGFGGAPGQGSTQLHSGWVALGLAAAGRNPIDVERRGRSLIDYTRAAAAATTEVGEVERTLLVVQAAGLRPRSFGGQDLLTRLLGKRAPDGSFEGRVNHTAFGILALRAAGRAPRSGAVRSAAAFIAAQQNEDGGFGFGRKGGGSDVDDTGAVLQALAAAGRARSSAVRRAVSYLRSTQNADGGFPQMRDGESNAQSSSFAVQGLVAAGRDPEALRKGSRTPLGYLRSLQAGDGSVRYSRTSAQTPVWVTAQALAAFERAVLPIGRVERQRSPRSRSRSGASRAPKRGEGRGRSSASRKRGEARAGPAERLGPPSPPRMTPRGTDPVRSLPARAETEGSGTGALIGAGAAATLALAVLGLRRRRRSLG